jgi:alkylation response protein AidB-like acyl-CoA dehydrogenase
MLVLQEDEKMLAESAQELLASLAPVSQQRALRDNANSLGFEPDVWQQFIDMGWTAIPFAEDIGGLAFSYKGLTSIFEQIGRNLSASPLLSTIVLAGTAIDLFATQTQREHHLPLLLAGEQRYAFALEEAPYHNVRAIETYCQENADTLVLNGSKQMVIDAIHADAFIVVAKSELGFRLIWVPSDTSGVTVTKLAMIDSRNYACVEFDNVTLARSTHILSEVALTVDQIESIVDVARACLCAELLGMSEALFSQTVDYLKTRVQFDVPIGSFQALQHRAAWLFTELELARSCVLHAAVCLDEFKQGVISAAKLAREVSLAMYKVSVMADKVSTEAIQLHGGIGVTDELDLGLYLKRIRVAQALFGDRDFHVSRYAQAIIS